jgi:hypothetical protein
VNSYLAKLTPYYLQLAEEIEQIPDSNGVVKRSAGKLLPDVARSIEHFVLKALPPLIESKAVSTSVSLDKNLYNSHNPYNAERFKYNTHIERALNKLIDAGYIIITTKGWQDRVTGHSDNTKYRLTTKFKTWLLLKLKEVGFSGQVATLIVDPKLLPNPIPIRVQRRKEGDISALEPRTEKLPFEASAKSEQISHDVEVINRRLANTWVDLDLTSAEWETLENDLGKHKKKDRPRFIRYNERQLYRVFHDTEFTTGGRYYGGWWQTIPRDYRKHVVINGKATVEIDYSGLHPAILYAKEGLPLPEDPYTPILGKRHRSLAKKLFNALINAKVDPKAPPRGVRIKFPDQPLSWEQIKERVYEVHAPIKQHFCSGAGLWLMHEDSVLATGVLHYFASMGAPCLPVHDSFLVHHGHKETLHRVMRDLFIERYGLAPNLKDTEVVFYRDESETATTTPNRVEKILASLDLPQEHRLSAFLALSAVHNELSG